VVGVGTPEEISKMPTWTGKYLRKAIKNEKLAR